MENETFQGQSSTQDTGPKVPPASRHGRRSITGAVVLIVLGVLFLAENFVPGIRFVDYWPLILVAIGVSMLWRGRHSA